MLRGGVASGGQRGLLLGALLATPACGLIVGFEPRECPDCSDSAGGAAGTDLDATDGTETSVGGSEVSGANAGGATSGALTPSSSGGSEGGTETTSSTGGTETTSGTGGTETTSGTGGTETTSGTGGTETTSGTGGVNATGGDGGATTTDTETTGAGGATTTGTEATGTGGATTSGSGGSGGGVGGATTTTVTTTTSGEGGSAGAGGNGGSGGDPAPCTTDETVNVTYTGAYPAHLMVGRNNASRPWDVTWLDGDSVYFAAYNSNGSVAMSPTLIDDSGTHSAPVVTTQSQYAFVAYGELDGGDASIVMNRLNPLAPEVVLQDSTGALEGDAAPDVMGVALRGTTNDALVAAIDSDGAGVLALFSDSEYVNRTSVPGSLTAVAPLDLAESFAVAFIQDGTLQIALVPHDLSDVEIPQEVEEAAPTTTSERSLAGARFDGGAALVWAEGDGIYLTTINTSGVAADRVQVSYGANDILPMVDTKGSQIMVSWLDADTETLYMRRFLTGLSGDGEAPFVVSNGVADTRYGFGAEAFLAKPTFGFAFAVDRLKVTIVTCL